MNWKPIKVITASPDLAAAIATRQRRISGVCAFTLVELLMVIAIIGFLAALLVPTFPRSKDKTRQTYCANSKVNVVFCDGHVESPTLNFAFGLSYHFADTTFQLGFQNNQHRKSSTVHSGHARLWIPRPSSAAHRRDPVELRQIISVQFNLK